MSGGALNIGRHKAFMNDRVRHVDGSHPLGVMLLAAGTGPYEWKRGTGMTRPGSRQFVGSIFGRTGGAASSAGNGGWSVIIGEDLTSQWSGSVWAFITNASLAGYFLQAINPGASLSNKVGVGANALTSAGNEMLIETGIVTGDPNITIGTTPAWRHLATTTSVMTSLTTFYIDGVARGTVSANNNMTGVGITLVAGGALASNTPLTQVGPWAFWRRTLSPEEVMMLYADPFAMVL
jgi:hypothetical protein